MLIKQLLIKIYKTEILIKEITKLLFKKMNFQDKLLRSMIKSILL
ncbi:hypothetical protein [Phage Phass-1]|uniref:Uncharacterized protein n=1 Tax=Phage Phass-1 TaxID=3043662 RepID=A0AAF0LVX8_9CAUD|nr:hypothetical protein [Phage Phass-1]